MCGTDKVLIMTMAMMMMMMAMKMMMMGSLTYSGQKWSGSEPLCEEINCGKVKSKTL